MQQVADWLEKLGLGQYAQRFAENDISFAVLPDLTDQHLKEIGVSLGHRLQLLRAIANLDKTAVASAPAIARPPTATTPVAPLAEAAGERRHVTVMFCDLVDSTGIAAKLDAEEWRDLVGAYLDAASTAVTELGGKVAKKLGDGLMALFGYPVAQEKDAERAVRAALGIQRALAELNRKNAGTGKPELAPGLPSIRGRWWWMHRAKFSATCRISQRGYKRRPSRVRSWSRREFSVKSPACSSPKSAAAMNSKACRSR
jgi:hypothetical protein